MAADVVDDLGSGLDGAAGCGGVVGIDGEDGLRTLLKQRLDDGKDSGLFFFRGKRGGVRTGGFAAEIEDVGALIEHHEGLRDGTFGGVLGRIVEAAVGEGVGRDVEDAHDEGSATERECAGAELPVVMSARGEGHGGILCWLLVVR